MKTPEIPADEAKRIHALRAYNLLDTLPEERFDRLTRLARRLFDVPIALVSLVDVNRQWFKSCQGLAATETSRDVSFCAHAILQDDILLVPNTLSDERFYDNPLVTGDPGIRFYAGCPLIVPNGSSLGTLCLIDIKPRDMGDDERQLLRDLAKMAEQEIGALQMATMDELTLVANRRGFEAQAQQALTACQKLGVPATMLFFDLNDFKGINDQFGHAEGDRALTVFAGILSGLLRETDVVGRLGGDEFVALLTNASHLEAAEIMQRLHEAVVAWNLLEQRGYNIKFSVGQTEYDSGKHASVQALLADSDQAMYSHKQLSKKAVINH
ncbi:GGDEF domain-containing protein [Rahnella victoriana]|uniref:GGDEF domain-containing protein n=1 Tax=Rahnella victoriana TaxID=1510570 RepID=UPI000E6D1FEC|nr:sensor domain-containing diguanylate cyclase [Rahnella victoriana]UHM89234.1 sensor domain-containing diguanylate cyclase [Rahnella victoriana]